MTTYKILIITSLLTLGSCSSYRSSRTPSAFLDCDSLLTSLIKETYYDESAAVKVKEAFNRLNQSSPGLIGGSVAPNWDQLDNIQRAFNTLDEVDRTYQFPSKQDRDDFFYRVFAETTKGEYWYGPLKVAAEKETPLSSFKPTERNLIAEYRALFERVNSFIPEELRIVLKEIPLDKEHEELERLAEEVYQAQVERAHDLMPTAGFKSYKEFQDMVDKNATEIGEPLIDTLRNNKVEFAMRRPSRGRWWVQRTGFHNQHVTGSSRGALNNAGRDKAEAAMIGVKFDEYTNTHNNLKPKYGFMRTSRDSELKLTNDGSGQYGDDIYVFKQERVNHRLMWTKGDSLGHAWNVESGGVDHIMDMFIPWKFRELIMPYLQSSSRSGGFHLSVSPEVANFGSYQATKKTMYSASYFETQIWGPLDLDDVAEFTFLKEPPTGEFLNALRDRGIKIFDGTKAGAPAWNPPALEVVPTVIEVTTKKAKDA